MMFVQTDENYKALAHARDVNEGVARRDGGNYELCERPVIRCSVCGDRLLPLSTGTTASLPFSPTVKSIRVVFGESN